MKPAIITTLTFAFAAFAASASMVGARSYPTKPIRFIATEVLGSATDIQARIIARGMAPLLGQPIEIENIFGERTITCVSANWRAALAYGRNDGRGAGEFSVRARVVGKACRRAGRRPDPVGG